MRNRFRKSKNFLILSCLGISLITGWSCTPKDPGTATENRPPVAHLANVPNDDTVSVADSATTTPSSLVKLYWVGNDADGFVTAFMYRWSFKDSNLSPDIKYRRWTVVLNYVPYTNRILILNIDSAQTFETAPKIAPQIFKFFANTDLDLDKRDPASPLYDTALVHMFNRIDNGDTITIFGTKVFASNPATNPYPVHESPNSGTFIFESNDLKNRHKFEIVAIDNEGAVGDTDSVRFWTKQVEHPRISFVANNASPSPADSVFVLFNTTYTWHGLPFTFKASDRNSRTWEYSWKVDTNQWSSWSAKTIGPYTAVITASQMATPYTGTHTFYVHARNEFGSQSPDSFRTFRTIYPGIAIDSFPKKVLVINTARPNGAFNEPESPQFPSILRMNSFYKEVLDSVYNGDTTKFTLWPGPGQPPLSKLASYTTVVILQGNWRAAPQTPNKMNGVNYGKYLDVGGNLLWDGANYWVLLQVIENADEVFHRIGIDGSTTEFGYVANRDTQFVGAFPSKGYPAVSIDPQKLDSLWHGAIGNMSIVRPRGFGERIYLFDSQCDDCPRFIQGAGLINFERGTTGIRYLGATFKSVYFGFPLYYIQKSDAINVMKKGLHDLGEF